jgi:hypothetical protein
MMPFSCYFLSFSGCGYTVLAVLIFCQPVRYTQTVVALKHQIFG